MQSDFKYIQDGQTYEAKLWTERAEAEQQAISLAEKTQTPHGPRAVGELGWVCVRTNPRAWLDACNVPLVPPRNLLKFQQLRQAIKECRVHLELDYSEALAKIRNSWVTLNPKRLISPKEADYEEAALMTVFLLDGPEGIRIPLEQGVELMFEQDFRETPPIGRVAAMSQNLSSWWKKHVTPK